MTETVNNIYPDLSAQSETQPTQLTQLTQLTQPLAPPVLSQSQISLSQIGQSQLTQPTQPLTPPVLSQSQISLSQIGQSQIGRDQPLTPTPSLSTRIMSSPFFDIAVQAGTQMVGVATQHGFAFVQGCAQKKVIDAFLDSINPHIGRCVKINAIWNLVLFVLILLNKLVFAPKLFLLYFVASYSTSFYGANKVLAKIESVEPILNMLVPRCRISLQRNSKVTSYL